ncbi:MAG: response regulator transcription factor [Candidatus Eremiobacteraeota bacterium]|nr:response regulator transcription factor [Candidatus Eremiobacteraeota bacterium]
MDYKYEEATRVLTGTNPKLMRDSERLERDAWLSLLHLLSEDEPGALRLAIDAYKASQSGEVAKARNLIDVNNVERTRLILTAVLLRLNKRKELQEITATLRETGSAEVLRSVDGLECIARRQPAGRSTSIKPPILGKLHVRLFPSPSKLDLTGAELRVLKLLAEGLTSKEAAARLGRSPKTIDNQVESILAKLGAQNRLQAVSIARQAGVLTESEA